MRAPWGRGALTGFFFAIGHRSAGAADHDVRVTHRISALISSFGVLVSVLLLLLAVREHRDGAPALWIGAGAAILLSASYALARDVRRLRTGPVP
ncbi:hypothetical protein OG933_25355 [Streptomyces sp. NBC_00016]|uniref:hypothetical protein n=1 Tax=Streptomyces sp. NBC_00016 TaxID=2975622 RepID=UPI0032483CAD